MIVPDLNLLLYATFDGFPLHAAARAWWEDTLSEVVPVGLVAPVVFGYLRLTTSRRVFDAPLSVDDAVQTVESWLARPNVVFLSDGPRQLQVAFELLRDCGAAGNLTTDAQIASHALILGATVYSHDTDFARFPRVSWRDPLGRS